MRRVSVLFSLLAVSSGFAIFAASGAGCVSDVPVAPDGGDGGMGGGEGGGAEGGADSGPPPMKCVLSANSPGRLPVHTVGTADAGLSTKIDPERFGFFHLSGNKAAIMATANANGGNNTIYVWVFDVTQGNPSAPPTLLKTIPTNRVLEVFRTTNGLGVGSWDQVAGNWGFTVYNVTEGNVLSGQLDQLNAFPARAEIVSDAGVYTQGQALKVLPLATDDYFLVGMADDSQNTVYQMISARLNGSPKVAIQSETQRFIATLVGAPGTIHAFTSVNATSTADYVFNDVAATFQKKIDYPQDLFFAIAPNPPLGYVAMGAVFSGQGLSGAKVGAIMNLESIDSSKWPVYSSNIDFGSGTTGGWVSLGPSTPPDFLMIGPPASGKGLGFLWFDASGNLRAAATGPDTLLTDVQNIAAAGVVPTGSFGNFSVTWVSRENGVDTVYYGKIACK